MSLRSTTPIRGAVTTTLPALPRTPLAVLVAATLITMAQAPLARADDTAAPTKLEKIEVTGSSIRRVDTETPSPVQILTAEDIKKSGYTSLSEVLRNVSANNQGTLSQSFNGAFAAGASGIALRGLTVGNTLVLIDGHRGTPYPLSDDGERSFVDVSSIPFDAVERVEILKDGASSVYGSDAIAGVVNIILKKSFEGTRLNVEAGSSKYGDGTTEHLSVISGFRDLLGEGGKGYFTAEYRHQSPILQINRPYLANRDYTAYGGINATRGISNPANAGFPASLTGYTVNAAGTVLTPLPGGCGGTAPVAPGGINCPFSQNDTQLAPDTHNVNLLAKYTQALANDWTASVTASMFGSAAEQVANNYTGTPAQGSFLPAYFGGTNIAPGFTVPNGIIGSDGQQLATTLTSLGTQRTRTDNENYRLIGELNGAFHGWDMDLSGGYTKSLLHTKNTGYLYFPGLNSLLAANPNATAAQLNTILQNPANAATLSPEADGVSSSELDFITLRGEREVARLPGGPLALSLGIEAMHKDLHSVAPTGFTLGQYNNGNLAYAIGEQDTESAYFELDGQVLKNLELDLSGRYDSVNTFGSAATPKFGFKYSPVQEATLRGTYARGFRAPNAAEAGNSQSVFFYNSVSDPRLCPGGGTAVGDFPSQCAGALFPAYLQQTNAKLQPEKSGSFTLGLVLEPISNFSATVDYYRIRIDNQIVTSAYITPSAALLQSAIRGPGQNLPQITGFTANGTAITATNPTPAGAGPIAFIPSPYLNSNSTVTNGVDIDLVARFDLKEDGKLTSNLNINHVFHLTVNQLGVAYEEAGTHGPGTTSGDTGTPQTRATWNWTWSKGPLEVSTNVNYISGYGVTDPLNGLNDCTTAILSNFNGSFFGGTVNPGVCHVASFTTFDLYSSYQLTKQLSIRGSVLNLFDRQAPLDLQTYGSNNYNPSLHQSGAVGRFLNVGATYTF